jgi:hypothetical protein
MMTPKQIELARHALGLPSRSKASYRNHFCCSQGHSDFDDWREMTEAGYATYRKGNAITGGDDLFRLTLAGASLALRRGECLDMADFPKPKPAPSVVLQERQS